MNGLRTKVDVNIIPLASCDYIIGMDWLKKHHVVLDYTKRQLHVLMKKGSKEIFKALQEF